MTQAAPSLASRKKLCWAAEKEKFLKTEEKQKKEIINQECIVSSKVALLRETEGVYQWIIS